MSANHNSSKQDLPLASAAEITALTGDFLNCTLPYQHWTHRAHLAVALTLVRQHGAADALQRIRQAIWQYNACCGDPQGYNETITCLFIRAIAAGQGSDASLEDLAGELMRLEQLFTVDWLYAYYSRELIWSEAAKEQWQEPDVRPLDF